MPTAHAGWFSQQPQNTFLTTASACLCCFESKDKAKFINSTSNTKSSSETTFGEATYELTSC